MLNRQACLERATLGLVQQNDWSVDEENGRCLYRGPNGRKCGVGHLIPDERYNPDIELAWANSAKVLRAIDPALGSIELSPVLALDDGQFLNMLQRMLHDRHASKPLTVESPFHEQRYKKQPFSRDLVLKAAKELITDYPDMKLSAAFLESIEPAPCA